MPLNVLGAEEAVAALACDIETERAKDAGYPWTFEVREGTGPVLCGDEADLTERQHRTLITLTKLHPNVVIVTGQLDLDDSTGKVLNADLLRYAKGRRRTVASIRSGAPDRREQITKMLKASLRYDRRCERV